jgi:hypothetical protein
MLTSPQKPSLQSLNAIEFCRAVHRLLDTNLLGPIVGAPGELNHFQRNICRSVMNAGSFANHLAEGTFLWLDDHHFTPMLKEAESLFETARHLEARLYQARTAVGLPCRVATCGAIGTSATFALACLPYQITGAVLGMAGEVALSRDLPRVASKGKGETFISTNGSLASAETARRAKKHFAKDFPFPDPAPLFAEMRAELMGLMGTIGLSKVGNEGDGAAPEAKRDGQPAKPSMKEPTAKAFLAYRLWEATGERQKDLAATLERELGQLIGQGQISRWLRSVREWNEAGGTAPDLQSLRTKLRPIDPALIDMGRHQEGRPPRQRGRRDPSSDD